jgi:membrane-bound serine protease (ClpP class)
MLSRWCAAGAFVVVVSAILVGSASAAMAAHALLLEIDGAIGPAIADYVRREFQQFNRADTRIVILRMNTPGGLDASMREIIRLILSSPVPVVSYVAPNGARAASAGTYIAYASTIAAMAPGTNLGAATPIRLGGWPQFPDRKPEQPNGEKDRQDHSGMSGSEPADTETRKVMRRVSESGWLSVRRRRFFH